MILNLVNKFGSRKVKIGALVISAVLTVAFAISLYLAIKFYIDFNTITAITM